MQAASILDTILDGRYRLLRLIGAGGGGNVYEAENVRTLHRVAIKVLHNHLLKHAGMLERFRNEAQAAGRIGSDKIVRAFDLVETPDGNAYLVMECLDGEDLATWTERAGGVVDPEELAPIAVQILDALVAAHDVGIVHRDMKPDNVFLTASRDGFLVKILDFGVSKVLTSGQVPIRDTRPGIVVGSPMYMSPEQARGKADVDGLTDVYAVGVILFECVTGRTPFQADNFNDLLFKIVLEDAPNPIELSPDLDPAFAALIHRAMKRDRAARFRSAREFRDAVSAWIERAGAATDTPWSGRRPAHALDVSQTLRSASRRTDASSSRRMAAASGLPNLSATAEELESPVFGLPDPVPDPLRSEARADPVAALVAQPAQSKRSRARLWLGLGLVTLAVGAVLALVRSKAGPMDETRTLGARPFTRASQAQARRDPVTSIPVTHDAPTAPSAIVAPSSTTRRELPPIDAPTASALGRSEKTEVRTIRTGTGP